MEEWKDGRIAEWQDGSVYDGRMEWPFSASVECVPALPFILNYIIRESVDSLCRDGADTPIVRVHRKAFLTRERSRSKPVWTPSYSSPAFLYPTIPPK